MCEPGIQNIGWRYEREKDKMRGMEAERKEEEKNQENRVYKRVKTRRKTTSLTRGAAPPIIIESPTAFGHDFRLRRAKSASTGL